MACLKPKLIRNPTEDINANGGQPLYIEVPCNNCAECKKAKRLEWRFRAFHQCQDTINKGGYIYFDTLTYDDNNVPYCSHFVEDKSIFDTIGDFMCFNHTHFKNFLKNIRRQLDYHYKGLTFKYFLSSEYGTDDRYTHRPHYHILFFIESKTITPFDFSELVSKCWPYGRTDGLPYQDRVYIMEHTYGFFDKDSLPEEIAKKIDNPIKLCNYVAKYVTKDSTFQKTLDSRLSLLEPHFDEDTFKSLKRNISMFNRQSQGFGVSYINNLSNDEYNFLYNNSACRMEDSKKVVLTIPLPLYYSRKLFYKCIKKEDGKSRWILTKIGQDFKSNYVLKCIEKVAKHYMTTIINAKVYDEVIILLEDRTIEDFAIYKLFYQNRLRNFINVYDYQKTYCKSSLTDVEFNLYDWLKQIYTLPLDSYSLCRNRNSNTICLPSLYTDLFDSQPFNYDTFLKIALFTENSCPEFRNFDKIDKFLKYLNKEPNKLKQRTFDFIEDLQKRFKTLFYE